MEEELKLLYDKKKYGKMCDKILFEYLPFLNVHEYKANKVKMEREILLQRGTMSKESIRVFTQRWLDDLTKAKNLKYKT